MSDPSPSFDRAHPSLKIALVKKAYAEPTAVQAAVLAADAARDLLVSAQTGSGKTVAFGLGIAATLLGEELKFGKPGAPLALVVTPTRELAQQVFRELQWLFSETGARIATCVGGFDPRRETDELRRGVHIVVGTPGRLSDHLARGALTLSKLACVVLDEADEMLDMGFREDIEKLLESAPAERRTLLFSATIPRDIAAMAKKFQKDALRLATQTTNERHADIEYCAVPIVQRERDLNVVNMLRFHDAVGALVFCATRDGVTHLAANLAERGFAVAALSGELTQRERTSALQQLRDGRARVCVATDVAARGLDLPDLGLVIHADLPNNAQTMVHRSGRTGRAGKRGLVIVLVPDNARRYVERMFQTAHVDPKWMKGPSAEDILAKDQERLVPEVAALAVGSTEEDRAVAKKLLETHKPEELIAALVRQRREARPAPEELTIPPSMRPGRPAGAPMSSSREGRDRPQYGERSQFGDRANGPSSRGPSSYGPSSHGPSSHGPRTPFAARGERTQHAERPRVARPAEGDTSTGSEGGSSVSESAGAGAESGERRSFGSRKTVAGDEAPTRGRQRGAGDPPPGGGTWFSVNVGRYKNADPKWLIPLLCRRGDITKREIGKIQVLARETRVEIAPAASDHFAQAVQRPDPQDANIHIERIDLD